jgi:hypothetical protein
VNRRIGVGRWRLGAVVATVGAASVMIAAMAGTATASAPPIPFPIVNYNSLTDPVPKCLGTMDGQTDAVAWLWECNSNPDQTWHIGAYNQKYPSYFEIVNASGDGMCLGVDHSSLQEGAPVVGWECNGNKDQYWTFVSEPCVLGYQEIKNLNSQLVVGVLNNGDSNGDAIVQWADQKQCNNQDWFT